MLNPSMCSAGASPAKTSALPEREQGLPGSVRVFGQSTPVWLASYDRPMSLWRTSQLCLDGGSAVFSETFPRSGMTRSGTAYRLLPLVPLTRGTASGSSLIPTPTAGDSKSSRNAMAGRLNPNSKHHSGVTLTDFVTMWPPPLASSGNGFSEREVQAGNPKNRLVTAVEIAEREQWATPTAWLGRRPSAALGDPERWKNPERSNELSDQVAFVEKFKTPTAAPFSHGGSGGELHKQVAPSGGPLNPQWVAWLMGFPIDWLD